MGPNDRKSENYYKSFKHKCIHSMLISRHRYTPPPQKKYCLLRAWISLTAELTETKTLGISSHTSKLMRFYTETELAHQVLILIQINKLHKPPEETQLGGRIICPEIKILRRLFFISGREPCCHWHYLLLSCKWGVSKLIISSRYK